MNKHTRLLKWFLGSIAVGTIAVLVVAIGIVISLAPRLPPVESLSDIQLQVPLRIYSRDGLLLGEFGEKRRTPVTYAEVPQAFIDAILAAEDSNFMNHHGVDIGGLLRAATQLVSTGRIQSGGSTITMQVAKNYFLTRERTFTRKFTEILLALKIEQSLSKEQILELYFNKIYLGHRAYGIGAAAQIYYGTSIDELDLAQLAMIAGLPQAPSVNNPISNPERAVIRRNWILSRMQGLGSITEEQSLEARSQPVTASRQLAAVELSAPWVAEMARAELVDRFGPDAYTAGYRAYTTVDSRLQKQANVAVLAGLVAYDRRHGYRKPDQQLPTGSDSDELPLDSWQGLLSRAPRAAGREPAGVVSVEDRQITVMRAGGELVTLGWEQGLGNLQPYIDVNRVGRKPRAAGDLFAVGDLVHVLFDAGAWRIDQIPDIEAAHVSLNPEDGAILAMVGGLDFNQSNFNRVNQARRQPGSAFKPFMYAAALEHGFSPASIINDAPVVFDDARLEATWRPVNSSGRFYGPTRLRQALYLSRNLVSIRLLRAVGIGNAIDYATRFGFADASLPRDLSLALGSLTITPMELTSAYAVLANGGYKISPYLLTDIVDIDGISIYQPQRTAVCRDCPEAQPEQPDAGNSTVAELIPTTDPDPLLLTPDGGIPAPQPAPRVIDQRVHYLIESMLKDVVTRGTATRARVLKRSDLAGKTGTTNGPADAWFAGYTPDVVTTTWVGFDQNQPLGRGEFGGSAALPIWIDYMRTALEEKPVRVRERPDGLTVVRIDPTTGLLARPGQRDAIFETFRDENVPDEYADSAPGASGTDNGGGQFIEEGLF